MRWHRDLRRYLQEARRYRAEHGDAAPAAGVLWQDFSRWRRSQREASSPLTDGLPWVTFAMRRFLGETLAPHMSVFEWGSGGSTLFFAARTRHLVTIEHDAGWLDAVRAEMAARLPRAQWEGRLEVPAPASRQGKPMNPADPQAYVSSDEPWRDFEFRNYASAVDAYPDHAFDMVVVDGRARPSCAAHAIAKVKPGGYLVLDNSERAHYACIHRRMRELGWPLRELSGPGPYLRQFWGGSAWRRPA